MINNTPTTVQIGLSPNILLLLSLVIVADFIHVHVVSRLYPDTTDTVRVDICFNPMICLYVRDIWMRKHVPARVLGYLS